MRIRSICEAFFPNGNEFDSDLSDVPFMPAKKAANIAFAYHHSNSPELERTGILTREQLGLQDLYKSGLDSTYQNAVYLTVDPSIKTVEAQYLYKVSLKSLDRQLFRADEDACGHCAGISDDNDWIGSIMCMGSFRYEGAIPPQAVRRLS